jgi:lipopolysaccharide transport system ATP-binding protein
MADVVIQVEDLGKQYRLGATSRGYKTIRESLMGAALAPIRGSTRILRLGGPGSRSRGVERFWALEDVTFSVRRGETVGVIGRNGAGKSTLLKLLSQITEPTKGRIAVRGRAAALLEVGTGFHPELSGKENIFLNGAILGMPRSEILRKFDQIVSFAEVEKFVDTPVKHYSSGMYLRLAFAVAAHLEPDILIVDEVLAVGDASFQKKCLNKMENVGNEGRTVLFVSHDMSAITRLCRRAILLDAGRKVQDGPAHQVASEYLRSGLGTSSVREWQDIRRAPGDESMRLRRVRVCSEDGHTIETVDIRRPFGIEMVFEVLEPGHALTPNLHLFNDEGVCIFVSSDVNSDWRKRPRPVGEHVSTMWVPGNLLAEGGFTVRAAVSTMDPVQVHADEIDAVAFHVVDTLEGNSARGDFAGPIPGVIRPLLRWTDEVSSEESVLSLPTGVIGK